MGIMLALVMVLSWFEHMLPQLPVLPPNFKFGLSNIVTMYCFFFVGKGSAVTLGVLKSLFVMFMRGPFAGILSFTGGMLSILVLILLISIFGKKISYVAASICGATMHNLGQIAAASLIVKTDIVFVYLPVLLIMGIIMGSITGILLKIVMPMLQKILNI